MYGEALELWTAGSVTCTVATGRHQLSIDIWLEDLELKIYQNIHNIFFFNSNLLQQASFCISTDSPEFSSF